MSRVTSCSQCQFECCNNWCTPKTIVQIVPLFEPLLRGMEEIQEEVAGVYGRWGFRVWGWREGGMWRKASPVDRDALTLHAPIKTRWNSVFDCINRACSWRTLSQGSRRMTWNLMGGSTEKMMKICQMGNLAESSNKWCPQHIPILCCSFICFFSKVCVFVVCCSRAHCQSMGIFSTLTIGHAMSNWGARWKCWKYWA